MRCTQTGKAKISTTPVPSAGATGQAGIHKKLLIINFKLIMVFSSFKAQNSKIKIIIKPDTDTLVKHQRSIGQKGVFCKGFVADQMHCDVKFYLVVQRYRLKYYPIVLKIKIFRNMSFLQILYSSFHYTA